MANVKNARDRLRSAGLRVTGARAAMLEALARQPAPVSAEELHAAVGTDRCDLVTVYRSLAAFAEAGFVRKLAFPDGRFRFALEACPEPARYSVVCSRTRQVEEIDPEIAADLSRALRQAEQRLRARGYTEVTHVVQFVGRAPAVGLTGSRNQNESEDRAKPAASR